MASFSKKFNPASDVQIAAVEKSLGVTFPTDYKKFLRATNGGIPTPNGFTVQDGGDALCDILYGISETRSPGDLQYEQEAASELDPLPAGVVAIGHDPGGNTILLQTFGKKASEVLFWDRNGLWVEEDEANTFPIAKSFMEFLAGLHEIPKDA